MSAAAPTGTSAAATSSCWPSPPRPVGDGDQLEQALAATDDPLEQIESIAETYVRFVIAHRAGFDLVFAPELRESDDAELRATGRRVIDLMMRPAIEASPSMSRALELNEELWTSAHGYASST